ncbi:hypothetical protein HOY82DRAFT_492657 [Tuber indicum]|nr:hypothetical protein HOY82DRAFT_492657 [Tuber indicum]
MTQPKGGEGDAPQQFLELVSEAPRSNWTIRCGKYYATASLFEGGKPKSLRFPRGGINILSDDPVRHSETFILKSGARTKFTTVFKLDHENVPNIPSQYFDISPRLRLSGDQWWNFKTKSWSFIFRRNLETILSHAMPLPRVDGETYRPYVLHNHDLINTYQTWSSSLDQVFYLLEIVRVLQQQNTADQKTELHYRKRIREVIFGYFVWLLRHVGRSGILETVLLHWSGELAPLARDGAGELVGKVRSGERRDIPHAPGGESSVSGAADPATLAEIPATKVDTGDPKTGSSLPLETPGSTSCPKKASVLYLGKSQEPVDPPAERPAEPELSKYEDRFQNCCRFLVLLDVCLTNYPDEKPLITRMVEAFLKLVWEPIEMSKHRESQLWPDRLEGLGEFPLPYARFLNLRNYENCGFGGQGIYVYDITTQVLVWRAVRSTNRLLDLVSGDRDWSEWMAHQNLDDKAIRDRTIEAFRFPCIDTSQTSFPDRLVSKIKGHIREPFQEKWDCIIAIPSFVEDFFDDDNKPISAWTQTLTYCNASSDSAKAQTPNTWQCFMRFQLAVDRDSRQELRESLEARAYSVGLFASSTVIPCSHCPCTTAWEIVTYVLNADHTELTYPQITDPPSYAGGAPRTTLPQESTMSVGTHSKTKIAASVGQEGRKSGKKGKGLGITAEDSRQVNDPPSYGEWYWFREPLFMKHKPMEFQINKEFIKAFLQQEYLFGLEDSWGSWCCFWETSEGKGEFLESMADMSHYDWGGGKNIIIQPYRKIASDFFREGEALSRLQGQRDRKGDKKRIIVVEDCMIEHLIFLMANLDFQEAGHISEFLSRLRLMDSHKMRFEEQTIMPDNLWITEFNINFITAPFHADAEAPLQPNYFPRRRAKFLSINDFVQDRIMAEAAMGFRIIGDLHDRCWTCYVFYDFGSQELISHSRTQVARREYGNSPSQRKCLEGFLVFQALDLVLSETKAILEIVNRFTGGGKKSQVLFNPLFTEDDLRGENYFKTMNKNSVLYPWLLEVYGSLRDKCIESQSVAKQWVSPEKSPEYKPRWSEKDQRDFGKEVAKNRANVKARCSELGKMADDLKERIDRIKTLKESLSSELQLREARTSTQLAYTVNLFAVVTTIYLPLTFSTSIVAIQDFKWPSPAKALVRITLAVTFGTVIFLMNLTFLRRKLAALKRWAQRLIRQRMAGESEFKGPRKEPTYPENQLVWECWKERARRLHEAEKRSTLLTDNDIHDNTSDWWHWYFIVIFIIIVVPVQELTFIIRTLRFQNIENSGPLKKFVRLPWAPIWVLQLALVYVIMLAWYAFLSLMGLVHVTAVWLWAGSGRSLRFKTARARNDRGLVSLLMKPAKTMKLLIVSEALHPKKEKESDEENQETVVVATEAHTSA